jgi:outer membrane protein assembly factor BamB
MWTRKLYLLMILCLLLTSCGVRNKTVLPSTSPDSSLSANTAQIELRSMSSSSLNLHEIWRKPIERMATSSLFEIPYRVLIAENNTLYIANFERNTDVRRSMRIQAIDIQTGATRWLSEPSSGIQSLTASPQSLFVATTDGIAAYDSTNGKKQWSSNQPPPEHESYSLFFDGLNLHLIAERALPYLFTSIDPLSGKVGDVRESNQVVTRIDQEYRYKWSPLNTLWLEDTTSDRSERLISLPQGPSRPVRAENILVLPFLEATPTSINSIFVVDLTTRKKLWECMDCFVSGVAVDDGKLYGLHQDGSLGAYDLVTGQLFGTVDFSGGEIIDPETTFYGIVASNGNVILYFGDTQELIALGPIP